MESPRPLGSTQRTNCDGEDSAALWVAVAPAAAVVMSFMRVMDECVPAALAKDHDLLESGTNIQHVQAQVGIVGKLPCWYEPSLQYGFITSCVLEQDRGIPVFIGPNVCASHVNEEQHQDDYGFVWPPGVDFSLVSTALRPPRRGGQRGRPT